MSDSSVRSNRRRHLSANPTTVTAPTRIRPIAVGDLDDAQRDALGRLAGRPRLDNIFATFIRHPRLFRPYAELGWYLLEDSTLPARWREVAILRVAARTGSGYELAQHRRIAARAGLDDAVIDGVINLSAVPVGLDATEGLILAAVDELVARSTTSDPTWAGLAAHLDEQQLMDLVFTIGAYCMIAFALNSFGVEVDERLRAPAPTPTERAPE